jgi:hypothetical protein
MSSTSTDVTFYDITDALSFSSLPLLPEFHGAEPLLHACLHLSLCVTVLGFVCVYPSICQGCDIGTVEGTFGRGGSMKEVKVRECGGWTSYTSMKQKKDTSRNCCKSSGEGVKGER